MSEDHPSLNLPFKDPETLIPQTKMKPNELCWCRSGKKWKKCHRDRESQTPINIWAQLATQRKLYTKGFCSHPDAPKDCGTRIVRAHTVQRRGGLAAIAESGHVISAKVAFERLHQNNGQVIPAEIGVRDASTFMGFCDRHDSEMFRPIESKPFSLTSDVAFLLSFRAICYEHYGKCVALQQIQVQREMDRGAPLWVQGRIQNHLYVHELGTKMGLEDMKAWKVSYDSAYRSKDLKDFAFYAVTFSSMLPVVACGAIYPEFTFDGQPLQKLARRGPRFEHVAFNVSVVGGQSIAVMGWNREATKVSQRFAESFGNLPPSEKAEAIVRLCFEHFENIYLRPGWWSGLPQMLRNVAIGRMRSGIGLIERKDDCLKPDGHTFLPTVGVTSELKDW